MKNKFSTIFGVLVVGTIITVSYLAEDFMENSRKKEDKEYLDIKNSYIEYKGIVYSKKTSRGYRGTTLFELNTGTKFRLYKEARNHNVSNSDISNFISYGDSIIKPANTDSIYVYRKGNKYYFVLGQVINKK